MKLLISSIALLLISLAATAQGHDRNDVYAVFTYRFTKMTEHPSKGDYKIVVFGNSIVAQKMEKFNNSVSNGRKIIIISTNKIEELKDANLVFVGSARSRKIEEVIAASPSAIIVTENDNMLSKGSDISFLTSENKVAFEISKANSEAKGIKLSKEILTYAKNVE